MSTNRMFFASVVMWLVGVLLTLLSLAGRAEGLNLISLRWVSVFGVALASIGTTAIIITSLLPNYKKGLVR